MHLLLNFTAVFYDMGYVFSGQDLYLACPIMPATQKFYHSYLYLITQGSAVVLAKANFRN